MKDQLFSLGIDAMAVLGPIVVTLLGALLLAATHYVQTKTKNTKVNEALDRFDDVVMAAVKEAQQTIISKLDRDKPAASLSAAKQAAIDSIRSHYGQKGIEELKKVLGWDNTDKVLDTKVEEKVHDLKLERSSLNVTASVTSPT